MNLKTIGLLTGLTLCGTALAQGSAQQPPAQPPQGQEQMGQPQPGQMGQQEQMGQMQAQAEFTGQVVGVQKENLLIRHEDGLIVPVKVTNKTSINGQQLKGRRIEAQLQRMLPEGQEVRASITQEKMDNLALSITVVGQGMGGSQGMQGQPGMQDQQGQQDTHQHPQDSQ